MPREASELSAAAFWLFLNTRDSVGKVGKVGKLVEFYVAQHNAVPSHSAFRGQTPDEMYFGRGDAVPSELDGARKVARERRLAANRALACPVCEPINDSDAA